MTPLEPLVDVVVEPWVAAIPKADLHVHQEAQGRHDRVLARRDGRAPCDWRAWAKHLMADIAPGVGRLAAMTEPATTFSTELVGSAEEMIIAKIVDLLEEAAADGAVLVEVRFGLAGGGFGRPDFMALFREAERVAQVSYPQLRAEALGFLAVGDSREQAIPWEQHLEACLEHAHSGLAGVDFVVQPYATEADPATWAMAYRWAARCADAGLGITVHAAEFSTANLDAALLMPGLRRLGHAVYAAQPRFLEQIIRQQLTVECCLSSNVVLGAVPSYIEHPIKRFRAYGIPVTLNTDDPVYLWTTIGREYAIAAVLGWSAYDLIQCTRDAILASFTTAERRAALLEEVGQFRVDDVPDALRR